MPQRLFWNGRCCGRSHIEGSVVRERRRSPPTLANPAASARSRRSSASSAGWPRAGATPASRTPETSACRGENWPSHRPYDELPDRRVRRDRTTCVASGQAAAHLLTSIDQALRSSASWSSSALQALASLTSFIDCSLSPSVCHHSPNCTGARRPSSRTNGAAQPTVTPSALSCDMSRSRASRRAAIILSALFGPIPGMRSKM